MKTISSLSFLVDEGIDSGPIVVQKKVRVDEKSQSELIKCTKKIGMDAIAEALELLKKENAEYLPNREEHATYFGFPTRQDVLGFAQEENGFERFNIATVDVEDWFHILDHAKTESVETWKLSTTN